MSNQSSPNVRTPVRSVAGRITRHRRQTAAVVRGLFSRRDSKAVFVGVSVVYLLGFLYMLNDLAIQTGAGVSVFLVDQPLATLFEPAPGPYMHRPIALIELWVFVWEFSPINTAIGLAIAVLVGLNLSSSYLAVVQPRACGIGAGTGIMASIPALFAGSACCAPVIVLVLGLQVSGTLLTAFTWLLPVSFGLLVLTLVYVATKIDTTTLAAQQGPSS